MKRLQLLVAAAFIALGVVVVFGATGEAVQPLKGVKLDMTATQDGGFVNGEITIKNNGKTGLLLHDLGGSLEAHFRANNVPPALPDVSTPGWGRIAELFLTNPGVVPPKSEVVIPYAIDLCAAAPIDGANSLRSFVVLEASDGQQYATLITRSDSFAPAPPDCASLTIEKVDQDGTALSDVGFDVTFPDGTIQPCTTDAAGVCEFSGLPAGDYTVNEPAPPGGYRLSGCAPDDDGGEDGAQVTLAHGDELTITCTNTLIFALEKTASQQAGFVTGEITITNPFSFLQIHSIVDWLEVHYPPSETPPLLPEGSSPGWFKITDVPIANPLIVEDVARVIPYTVDLCRAEAFNGADLLRNVVVMNAGVMPRSTVTAFSDAFEPVPPDCPSLTIQKVDQEGEPLSEIGFNITFPGGGIQSCTTDVAGRCEFTDLLVGAYGISEPAPPDGYRFDGCIPDGDANADGAQVTLAHSDDVTVTCTNTRLYGEGSCIGVEACTGLANFVGDNSCLGERACYNNIGAVGDNSCHGNFVCWDNGGTVGNGSCEGQGACRANGGSVGDGSCKGGAACVFNTGDIGDGSCDGAGACVDNNFDVGNGSCIGENACNINNGVVGDGSCLGENACFANNGAVGDGSCLDLSACEEKLGDVGNGSCVGGAACFRNSGNLGDGKCIGALACAGNAADMP